MQKSLEEAFKLFMELANQGVVDAKYHIAYRYKEGLGVEKKKL